MLKSASALPDGNASGGTSGPISTLMLLTTAELISIHHDGDELEMKPADIRSLIDARLDERESTLRGWRYLAHLVQKFGFTWAVVVGLLALIANLWAQTRQHYRDDLDYAKKESEFRTHTTDVLERVQADIRSLQAAMSARKVINDVARLDNSAFATRLPSLREAVDQSPGAVDPTPDVLRTIAQKLERTTPTAAAYWPTVLRFIQFWSEASASDVPAPGTKPTIEIQDSQLPLVTNHQVILLDGGELFNSRISNSRIIFTSKPIVVRNNTFVNCVFEFPITTTPNEFLQKASKQLLASAASAGSPSLDLP